MASQRSPWLLASNSGEEATRMWYPVCTTSCSPASATICQPRRGVSTSSPRGWSLRPSTLRLVTWMAACAWSVRVAMRRREREYFIMCGLYDSLLVRCHFAGQIYEEKLRLQSVYHELLVFLSLIFEFENFIWVMMQGFPTFCVYWTEM